MNPDRRTVLFLALEFSLGTSAVVGLGAIGCASVENQDDREKVKSRNLFERSILPLFSGAEHTDVSITVINEDWSPFTSKKDVQVGGVRVDVSGLIQPRNKNLHVLIPTGKDFQRSPGGRMLTAYVVGRDGRFFDKYPGRGVGEFEKDGKLVLGIHLDVTVDDLNEMKARGMVVYLAEEFRRKGDWRMLTGEVNTKDIKPLGVFNISSVSA